MIKKVIVWLNSKWNKPYLNFYKTFYINFILLKWKDAIKWPILIYGPCRIQDLSGKIKFSSPIKRGQLIIGKSDPVRSFHSKSFISIKGNLSIGEKIVLRKGINLYIAKNGFLSIEDHVYIGDNNTIIVYGNTLIGKATRVGNNTTFMDTDFHYIINTETRTVHPNIGSIAIGQNCWIGGNCIIKKNAKLPTGTILAGPFSMVGKSYINKIPEYSIIGGSPAKLLVEHQRRINNSSMETMLSKHFSQTNELYHFDFNIDLDEICMPYSQQI